MLRAIQEIKPTFVIAENVFGITNIDDGLVFERGERVEFVTEQGATRQS